MSTIEDDLGLAGHSGLDEAAGIPAPLGPVPVSGVDGPGQHREPAPPADAPWAAGWLESYLAASGITAPEDRRELTAVILARGAGRPDALITDAHAVLAALGARGAHALPSHPEELPGVMPLQNVDPPWRGASLRPWSLRRLVHVWAGLVGLLMAMSGYDV